MKENNNPYKIMELARGGLQNIVREHFDRMTPILTTSLLPFFKIFYLNIFN